MIVLKIIVGGIAIVAFYTLFMTGVYHLAGWVNRRAGRMKSVEQGAEDK